MPLSLENWWLGAGTYAVCHLVHLAWWQLGRPRRDVLTVFLLFVGIPIPLLAATLGVAPLAIHFWLSAQYLAIYPAFQASSPTLHMLAALSRAKNGVEETVLMETAASVDRNADRSRSLREGGLMKAEGSLTTAGRVLARVFLAYRSWLGLPEGEG